jgi:transcriptional regulator with XRE-family HTH domain
MARSIRPSANFAPPEWAKTVVRLRKQLGFPQATFGNTFHCSAMAVSRWERGISEPPSHTYIEMGNAAGDPQSTNDTPIITELLLPARDPRLAHGEHHHWTIRLTDRAVDELLDAGILSADLKQVKAQY